MAEIVLTISRSFTSQFPPKINLRTSVADARYVVPRQTAAQASAVTNKRERRFGRDKQWNVRATSPAFAHIKYIHNV